MRCRASRRCICLCLIWGLAASSPLPAADRPSAAPATAYLTQLAAFGQVVQGMHQDEVLRLLGAPDQRRPADSDNGWHDEFWSYDFRKLDGFPREQARRAVWEGDILFLHRQVVHSRALGWLE